MHVEQTLVACLCAGGVEHRTNLLFCCVAGIHDPALRSFEEVGVIFAIDESARARLGTGG